MNPRLEHYTESVREVMPGWPLEVVPQIDTAWAHTPSSQVAWLADTLAHAYPEAGRHYWTFRTWGLLVWQPVYLALAGIHLKRLAIRPECISQQASSCMVWGCQIADHIPFEGNEHELLDITAATLRDGVTSLYSTCTATMDLHPKAASRLLADYVTGATLRIKDLRPDWSVDLAVDWGERWLQALGLQGAGGFLRFDDHAGKAQLAIERKVCCLVYKRNDGILCDTCPKIPLADRLAKLARR